VLFCEIKPREKSSECRKKALKARRRKRHGAYIIVRCKLKEKTQNPLDFLDKKQKIFLHLK
jgi:hypothetical protein